MCTEEIEVKHPGGACCFEHITPDDVVMRVDDKLPSVWWKPRSGCVEARLT